MSAASADALLKALIGSGSIGSSSQPIYYKDGKFYAGGYTFRLNHNTTDDKIPVFANGMLDYILKSELANATTGGGIVAANLAQNGYVKFSNGLILQWGITPELTFNSPSLILYRLHLYINAFMYGEKMRLTVYRFCKQPTDIIMVKIDCAVIMVLSKGSVFTIHKTAIIG